MSYLDSHPSMKRIVLGLVLQVLFFALVPVLGNPYHNKVVLWTDTVLFCSGMWTFIEGCCDFSEEKGWPNPLGLLGILSLLGLLILFCLPDKNQT